MQLANYYQITYTLFVDANLLSILRFDEKMFSHIVLLLSVIITIPADEKHNQQSCLLDLIINNKIKSKNELILAEKFVERKKSGQILNLQIALMKPKNDDNFILLYSSNLSSFNIFHLFTNRYKFTSQSGPISDAMNTNLHQNNFNTKRRKSSSLPRKEQKTRLIRANQPTIASFTSRIRNRIYFPPPYDQYNPPPWLDIPYKTIRGNFNQSN